jgi:hypothetical protein
MIYKINNGARILVVGQSNSGKSTFIGNLVKHRNEIFTKPFDKIFYCSKDIVAIPDDVKNHVKVVVGLPTEEHLEAAGEKLIIIDDQMEAALNSDVVASLFILGRHKRITTILALHNIFHKGARSRDISLNASIIVWFKPRRDASSLVMFGRQIQPWNSKFLTEICYKFMTNCYSYFVINLEPTTPEALKFATNIFNDNHLEVFLEPQTLETLRHETFEEIPFYNIGLQEF